MYARVIKPLFDFCFSLLLLILLSPLFLIIALILFIQNNGRVFFKQIRPGKNEALFVICKFKTMNDKKDDNGNLLPDTERITTAGKIIRKLSLDELPQLLNVLKGEMSFVGPRPLLPEYLRLYNEEQKKRHDVKPGVTGWAQVNGRNTISWKEKFDFDVYYVQHQSFFMDFKILLLTIKKVFHFKEVNQGNSSTMEIFNGNN